MKVCSFFYVSALAVAWNLPVHAQNLLQNGDFEEPPYAPSSIMTFWGVSGAGHIHSIDQGWTSASHSAAFSIGKDSEGTVLFQNFATTPGKVYTLDFDAGIFGFVASGSTLRMRVQVFPTGLPLDETITPTPSNTFNPALVDFDHHQFTFTATSATTTLQFTDIGLGNAVADQVIDSVIILPQLQLQTAASVKSHGSPGTQYPVNLPLTGEAGIECRLPNPAQTHTLVFTFTNSIVSGSASVTDGIGDAPGIPAFVDNTMTVELSGVDDQQEITVTLSGVTDEFGQVLPDKSVKMNVLLGDTTEDKSVNSGDISQTKSQSGSGVDGLNFREDVTCDNSINSADISLVKSRSGNGIVPVPHPGYSIPESRKRPDSRRAQGAHR